MTDLILHTYWRSGAAYRVRIALALKGLTYQSVEHDLRTGAHKTAEYLHLAPQGLVPSLQYGNLTLTQSPAIMEWLEETFPEPPLLPKNANDKAIVRAMAALIACDIHPLNNLRVLKALKHDYGQTDDQQTQWAGQWISAGFTALEQMVTTHGKSFCFGPTPTLADCYLIPQIYSAQRFKVDLRPYPRLMAINDWAAQFEPIKSAHPSVQPDADPVTP